VKLAIMTLLLVFASAAGCATGHHEEAKAPHVDAAQPMPVARLFFPTAGRAARRDSASGISANARWMARNQGEIVVLEGHCDERGLADYNMELGDRRARWVLGRLMDEGIDPARLIVISRGESRPADPGHGPRAWKKNRRVEFVRR